MKFIMKKMKYPTALVVTGCLILAFGSTKSWGGFWPFGDKGTEGKSDGKKNTAEVVINETPLRRDTQLVTSFSHVVKKVSSSVVSIYTKRTVRMTPQRNPFMNDPFFRRFFGVPNGEDMDQPYEHEDMGLGSGVLISKDGYVLTNYHVIENMDEMQVTLQDGTNRKLEAEIVGIDKKTDLAVLKVNAEALPAATLGDSDKIEVGDVVLAIGNPFGIGQTVTMGIVSAKGRSSTDASHRIAYYEDFIQTDASINPGNSGGALVDAEGRVIGINTAIYSRTGGNLGIGFAVPMNLARYVMEQIIQNGKVSRGYLGVTMNPEALDKDLAEALNAQGTKGVLISDVLPDSAAQEAGLQTGDIITKFNGQEITDNKQLRFAVAATPPGTKVKIEILRDGKQKDLDVTLKELPSEEIAASEQGEDKEQPDKKEVSFLKGVEITEIPEATERGPGFPKNIEGVLVSRVDPASSAFKQGLRSGIIIRSIERQPIRNVGEAKKLARKYDGKKVLLLIWQNGGSRYLLIKPSEK